jgi:hypothetical protein
MLTDAQRQQFDRIGLLRLPGAIPTIDATGMCARLWEFLASEHGIVQGRPQTWPCGTVRRLQAATRSGAFNPMASAVVCAALDDILGTDARLPGHAPWWGGPLVTFRSATCWTVPSVSWHLDGPGNEPGVTVFAYLAPVQAQNGGTLVVEGSHRLVDRYLQATGTLGSAKIKAGLAKLHPWLRDLWTDKPDPDPNRFARYLQHGVTVGGQHLIVRELTGETGDVVLMNARCLHAPAPNALTKPRMMLVEHVGRPWRAPA